MARLSVRLGVAVLATSTLAMAAAPDARNLSLVDGPTTLTLLADRDDDDDDGVPDAESHTPRLDDLGDVTFVDTRPRKLEAVEGSSVRLIVDGKPLAPAAAVGKRLRRFGLQGVKAGVTRLRFVGAELGIDVLELFALDGAGRAVDFARSHASLTRVLPVEPADAEALSFVIAGPASSLPRALSVSSFRPDRAPLDSLQDLALVPRACPAGVGAELLCRGSVPVRAAADVVDRSHPEAAQHSLVAEVGGRLLVGVGKHTATLRVGGPRESALGSLARHRGTLRVRLVRMSRGGAPPVGGDDAGALAVARHELSTLNAIWGQCGIVFGDERGLDVALVDPPGPHLVALGCDLATPASGGQIALRVDERAVVVETRARETPTEVAARLARALGRAGFRPVVSPNPRTAPGALSGVDVLVRRANGQLAEVTPLGEQASNDATLGVCIGSVDLSDGLSHFSDFDAAAGTLEERALLKALDDGDPSTLDVVVVPAFARAGRIGESFIFGPGASLRNTLVVDRAAVRAGARSFALAHELGHILLDLPGHPDDYGVDRPSLLMDADATDPSVFGPRRLTLGDCERAIRQSGPRAPVPLLRAWPLTRARSG